MDATGFAGRRFAAATAALLLGISPAPLGLSCRTPHAAGKRPAHNPKSQVQAEKPPPLAMATHAPDASPDTSPEQPQPTEGSPGTNPEGPRGESNAAERVEKLLFKKINESRELNELPPLRWQEELARYARVYSEELRATGNFTHNSPLSGGLTKRLGKITSQYQSLSENLAKASFPEEIHPGLMASSGHRANILNPEHNVVGIGVAIDLRGGEPSYTVTQIFGTARPQMDAAEIRTRFLSKLNTHRRQLNLQIVEENELLNKRAELSAARCFSRNQETDRPVKNVPFKQLTEVSFIASDPLFAIEQINGLFEPSAAFVGIGIRKSNERAHKGTVCVVVVLGTK